MRRLIGVTSDDAQVILNLPQGALPAHGAETAVRASFTPLDPKKLAKMPENTRPSGNAYRVEMTYQPSGAPVPQIARSGNVIMVVPDEADTMLYSIDGKSWDPLPSHQLGDPTTVGSTFNKPGYYVVNTALPEFLNPNKGSGTKKTVGIVMIVVASPCSSATSFRRCSAAPGRRRRRRRRPATARRPPGR